jgi:hypothetical protein
MTFAPISSPARWKAFLWSAFWSAVLTMFVRWTIERNNPCFHVVNDEASIRAITILIWFWLLLFLFFDSNRNRFILFSGSLILAAFLIPTYSGSKIASGEIAAVQHLRDLQQDIDAYGKQHPSEGYPLNLPKLSPSGYATKAEKLYKFEYKTFHSSSGGPADGYVIEVTPYWRDCGYIRSFTRAQDGLIHFTMEARPATVLDQAIQ